jgi:uncharacterized protein (TIGR01244 family)
MRQREVRPGLIVADQPSSDELRTLASEGFTAVVNLRHDGEPEQPVGPAAEGEIVRREGLVYQHYGVGGEPLSPAGVQAVARLVGEQLEAGGKVLLHCRKGARAAALALLAEAIREGWAAGEVLERGEAMGLAIGEPKLKALVEEYLANHGTS